MLEEVIRKYEDFSDALIYQVNYYHDPDGPRNAEVVLGTMNAYNNYKWEIIKISFKGVINFRFVEVFNTSSTVVNAALIAKKEDILIFDFFPLIYESGDIEDPNSRFSVHCKAVEYELIETEQQ